MGYFKIGVLEWLEGMSAREGLSFGELVDERDDDGCEEEDDDQVEGALYADVAALHFASLLVSLLDLSPDVVALHGLRLTRLIWLLIFSFWSPSSRMMLVVVSLDSLTTRFIDRSRLVWSSASRFRSSILSRLLILTL
jgi:hypothetical protein